jgi:hypothetical protein
MKKYLFLISFHFLTLSASFGQTSSGTFMLGGSVNLNGRNYQTGPTENTSSGYSLPGQAGVFVRDNLALGLTFNYSSDEYQSEYMSNGTSSISRNNIHSYFVGPFVREYMPITDKLFFFGQGTAGLSYYQSQQETNMPGPDNPDSKSKSRGAFAELSPGFTYFITSKIGLDLNTAAFTYNYSKTRSGTISNESTNQSHGFNVGLDLASLSYGIRFYLTR